MPTQIIPFMLSKLFLHAGPDERETFRKLGSPQNIPTECFLHFRINTLAALLGNLVNTAPTLPIDFKSL